MCACVCLVKPIFASWFCFAFIHGLVVVVVVVSTIVKKKRRFETAITITSLQATRNRTDYPRKGNMLLHIRSVWIRFKAVTLDNWWFLTFSFCAYGAVRSVSFLFFTNDLYHHCQLKLKLKLKLKLRTTIFLNLNYLTGPVLIFSFSHFRFGVDVDILKLKQPLCNATYE